VLFFSRSRPGALNHFSGPATPGGLAPPASVRPASSNKVYEMSQVAPNRRKVSMYAFCESILTRSRTIYYGWSPVAQYAEVRKQLHRDRANWFSIAAAYDERGKLTGYAIFSDRPFAVVDVVSYDGPEIIPVLIGVMGQCLADKIECGTEEFASDE
jgi:hypothetical protein